jgi:uncharacterized protein (TIGR02246 family)
VDGALAAFHAAFAAGDAHGLTKLFTDDARLLLLHNDARESHESIQAAFSRLFEAWDTSSWLVEPVIVDVHDDRAYTLSTYAETLVSRGSEPSRLVVGRLILFLRRDADGAWRVSLAMNSHVRPVEEIPTGAPRPGSASAPAGG